MALYEYQCECGVRFEATAPMKDHDKPQLCPACGLQAPRHLPDGVEGVFQQEVVGSGPQNTGISQIDAHIDRVIGQSARQGWQVVEERVAEKRRIVREQKVDGRNLSRNPDGTYRILAPEERGVHDRALAINSMAMTTVKQRRRSASGK